MRILFVTFSVSPFGSNDLLYYQAAVRALEQGHQVMVSAPDWGERNAAQYKVIAQKGAQVRFRDRGERRDNVVLRQLDKVMHKLVDPRKQWAFIAEFAPDVVVISDPGTYHMLGTLDFARVLLDLRVPFVTISQFNYENTSLKPELFPFARDFFRAARACVFVSQRNLAVARRQLCLPLEQAHVVDNPPNLASLEPEPFRQTSVPAFALVGRLESAVKGQHLVLDILSQPEWRARDWVLNLYGEGPDESYLRELIRFVGLQERVRLQGQATDIRGAWRENEILLLCSTGEGKPLAVMEAMVIGRPAVVSDVGGSAELVEEGVTGFVAESATMPAFTRALERAWHRRAEWQEMGRVAHERAMQRLNPPPHERLLEIITRAAQRS